VLPRFPLNILGSLLMSRTLAHAAGAGAREWYNRIGLHGPQVDLRNAYLRLAIVAPGPVIR
jgi:hypothetical protein